jgi:biopolymer transport protein ExbB
MDQSLWEVAKGNVALWVILACSVVSLAVALERLAAMWGFLDRARTLADTVNRCISRGATAEARTACERSKSAVADVFLVGFERQGRAADEQVDSAVERARTRMNLEFRRRLWVLGTVGAVAPFVGLYGTVVGIMRSFHQLKDVAGENQLKVVGPGISEALITTAAGILVAVLAVAIYNWLSAHMNRVALEVKLLVEEFLEALHDKRPGEGKDGPYRSTSSPKLAEKEAVGDGARESSGG